ncbi:DUF58 domain-containing protein [Couchioplanes caeruleus]|uniref:DUF58 domain-containing protein n=2 Tax=Couchioplanes caeruleus TaxID=56438 RepID=A0A1K0FHU2_9ACTN|nr:DUF58 domain-containing protein [Couchioplanes caeruleus]OJF12415.1 hypothetical protein BG844_20860 [Couchioplanes caeruleus subsp. caeruleus]ROP29478.1 uncharacterized protein (DUF58 family) [Couchioplanes caeruleus]
MVTRRFALLLALGVPLPALLPSPWLLTLAVAGLAIGAAVLDVLVAAPLTGVTLRRHGDETVWLGETATTTLTVANTSGRPMWLRLRDRWVPSAGADRTAHRLNLLAGEEREVTTTLTPTRHGDRAAVRVTLRSHGPLGLAYRQRRQRWNEAVTPAWTLRVLPRFPSRRLLPEKLAKLRVFDGAVVTRGRGQGTEFDVLREYVVGDDVRSIDWRASARTHDVVVRTWRPERDRRVVCVLDTGRTSAARIGDEPRLDAAIDAALLLAVLASKADDRVDLLAVDTAVRAKVEGGGHRTKLPRLISSLAALEPALVETDFGLAAGDLLRRGHKRALVVIFSALDAAPIVEGLLPLLSRLTTRHRVVLASVRDPETAELARLPASGATAEDVHLAAAAELALAERDRVRALLTQQGVIVVDEPRESFASKVCDVYLMLKAAGRL